MTGRHHLVGTVLSGLLLIGLLPASATGQVPDLGATGCATPGAPPATADARPGLSAVRALPLASDEPIVAIATHRDVPDDTVVARLRARGLTVQPLRHLPMSLLHGTVAQVLGVGDVVGVEDVYPDRRLQRFSRTSTAAIGADRVQALGYTGQGVGIAIVDTGIDATHPAFEDRVVRNVKLVGPEYLAALGLPVGHDTPPGTLAVPVDAGPYENTDLVGHGTHVAGIAAAADVGGDEVDSPVGVAPGADLVGYAVGEHLHAFAVLAAFDDILATHEEFGLRVVNGSWGARFELFDPAAPLHLATRALHDAGLVVALAAGNEGGEMTLSGLAVAPWVVSVGSVGPGGFASLFASGGLRYDNSTVTSGNQHVRTVGDGLGLYQPTVSAPGEHILSAATPTGVIVGPGPHLPGSTTTASGSSMATPHVAGLAALLLEADPKLTPSTIKQVLQATAVPEPGPRFWRSGFGRVDALAALELITTDDVASTVNELLQERTQLHRRRRDHRVVTSDLWSFDAAPVTVLGSDRRCFAFDVERGDGVRTVRALINFAGTLDAIGAHRNEFRWTLELRDAAGKLVATSEADLRQGLASLEIDLDDVPGGLTDGTWSLDVIGERAVGQLPLLSTPHVSVVVTQLAPQDADTTSQPPALRLALEPADGDVLPATSPEGCAYDLPPAVASLGDGSGGADEGAGQGAGEGCRASFVGFAPTAIFGDTGFVSAPAARDLVLDGSGVLVLHLADDAQPAWDGLITSRLLATVEVLPAEPGGEVQVISSVEEPAAVGAVPVRGEYRFPIDGAIVPAGSRLRIRLETTGAQASGTRLLYGRGYDSHVLLPLQPHADACGTSPSRGRGRPDHAPPDHARNDRKKVPCVPGS